MNDPKSYLTTNVYGVKRVGDTRISMDSVVVAFQQGQSAEEVQRNFPALSLEQVYGVIAYYLGHREEVDQYLSLQESAWNAARQRHESSPNPALERLRNARGSHARPVR